METPQPMARIAVDLLAVLPGGANGGAKLLALDLLAGLADDYAITCFCRPDARAEIAARLGSAIRIVCVGHPESLQAVYDAQEAEAGPFALNFFPMQRVSLHRVGTPCVSIVHDLQFADLPDNFSVAERAERAEAFRSCVEHSDLIVTVSEFSRGRIEAFAGIDGRRIRVIYNALAEEAPANVDVDTSAFRPAPYFLYPANFWPHKNHTALIDAYRIYRTSGDAPLDLVLTGAPDVAGPELAQRLRQDPGIVVAGYIDRDAFRRLLSGATALVFPSLYEGFGMPVVEAMAADIPVACSKSGSMPEVTGEAALLFDGDDVEAIAEAMSRLALDVELRAALVAAGRKRRADLGGFARMRNAYRAVFEEVIAKPVPRSSAIQGIAIDGSARREVKIELPEAGGTDRLHLEIGLPAWTPVTSQTLLISSSSQPGARRTLWQGHARLIDIPLHPGERSVTISALHDFDRRDVLDTPSGGRMAYTLKRAVAFANGRKIDLWPTAANVAATEDVALVVWDESESTAAAVAAVGVTAQPVAMRLELTLIGDRLQLEASPEPLMPDAASAPVAQMALPISAERPLLVLPAGIDAIAFRKGELAAPAIIGNRHGRAGFSVIIPSFNQGRFIGRTIESVLAQDHVHEVLVLDGGSTDETLDVLAGYGTRIRWWSGKDGGQADAVNRGLERSEGEFIAWINSDDTYAPGALAHVAGIFAAGDAIEVVYGDGDHVDENDRFIEPYPTADFAVSALRDGCFICQPAAFFRRSVVVRHGGLRPSLRYCLDYEFWLRLAAAGVTFERTPMLLAHSRMYAANKTMGERLHAYFETADMMIRSIGYTDGQWVENFANAAADLLGTKYGIPRAFALREARRLGQATWPRSGTS